MVSQYESRAGAKSTTTTERWRGRRCRRGGTYESWRRSAWLRRCVSVGSVAVVMDSRRCRWVGVSELLDVFVQEKRREDERLWQEGRWCTYHGGWANNTLVTGGGTCRIAMVRERWRSGARQAGSHGSPLPLSLPLFTFTPDYLS